MMMGSFFLSGGNERHFLLQNTKNPPRMQRLFSRWPLSDSRGGVSSVCMSRRGNLVNTTTLSTLGQENFFFHLSQRSTRRKRLVHWSKKLSKILRKSAGQGLLPSKKGPFLFFHDEDSAKSWSTTASSSGNSRSGTGPGWGTALSLFWRPHKLRTQQRLHRGWSSASPGQE